MRIDRLLVAGLAMSLSAVVAQELQPVPPTAAQRQAERTLRTVYKSAFASKFAHERLALAKTLLERARKREDDAAGQYVAFEQARILAAQASNIELALEAARACAGRFQVSPYPMQVAALGEVVRPSLGLAEVRVLVHTCLNVAQEAADSDDAESAAKACALARDLAKAFKDATLDAKIAANNERAKELKAWLQRVATARMKLAQAPDDAHSHLLLGQHEALRHGIWATGLEHLAAGDDADLKALAQRDRSAPAGADEQAALAESWYDLGERLTGLMRHYARQRALAWYEDAARGDVPVLAKVRMTERFATLRVERLTFGWSLADDPSLFEGSEDTGSDADGIIIKPRGSYLCSVRVTNFPYAVDGVSVRVRPGEGPKLQCYLVYDLDRESVIYDRAQGLVSAGKRTKQNWWDHRTEGRPDNDKEIWMTVRLLDSEAVVYIDGIETARVPTQLRGFDAISLDACFGSARFDQVKVHRQTW